MVQLVKYYPADYSDRPLPEAVEDLDADTDLIITADTYQLHVPIVIGKESIRLIANGSVTIQTTRDGSSPLKNAIEIGANYAAIVGINFEVPATRDPDIDDNFAAIFSANSNYVLIEDVTISNYYRGINLQGGDAVNLEPSGTFYPKTVGNRILRPRIDRCNQGILYKQQDRLEIADLIETNGTNIGTAPINPPHAIYGSGDDGMDESGSVTVSNCVSIGHQYEAAFKFKTGIMTVDGLHATADDATGIGTSALLIVSNGCTGTFDDLTLSGWQNTTSGPNVAITLNGSTGMSERPTALSLSGVVLKAKPGESALTGILVQDMADDSVTTILDARIQCHVESAGFIPFRVENAKDVSFLDPHYFNSGTLDIEGGVFQLAGASYCRVEAPEVTGSTRIVLMSKAGTTRSQHNRASFDGARLHNGFDPAYGFASDTSNTGASDNKYEFAGGVIGQIATTYASATATVGPEQLGATLLAAIGAAPVSLTLTLPTAAVDRHYVVDGTWVTIRRDDAQARRLIVKSAGGPDLAWLSAQGDQATFVYRAAAGWQARDYHIADLAVRLTTADTSPYTMPPLAAGAMVLAIGGGGGGGSGGTRGAGVQVLGGGGGSGGAIVERWCAIGELGGSVAFSIGQGRTGGAGVSTNDANGNPGTAGEATTFGGAVKARGGANGRGGAPTTGTGGSGQQALSQFGGAIGLAASANATGSVDGGPGAVGGGAAGGSLDAANTALTGGAGGTGSAAAFTNVAGGVPGTGVGAAGGAGSAITDPLGQTGGSGGAGGNAGDATHNGGPGGNGGAPGGPGGGGGATRNGRTSGAGGTGAAGEIRLRVRF